MRHGMEIKLKWEIRDKGNGELQDSSELSYWQ